MNKKQANRLLDVAKALYEYSSEEKTIAGLFAMSSWGMPSPDVVIRRAAEGKGEPVKTEEDCLGAFSYAIVDLYDCDTVSEDTDSLIRELEHDPTGYLAHKVYDYARNIETKHSCGTPSCALGHYAIRGDLQNFLALTSEGSVVYSDNQEAVSFVDSKLHDYFGVPKHIDCKNDLEIRSPYMHDLFGAEGCDNASTPEEAAEYIEDFVSRHYDG